MCVGAQGDAILTVKTHIATIRYNSRSEVKFKRKLQRRLPILAIKPGRGVNGFPSVRLPFSGAECRGRHSKLESVLSRPEHLFPNFSELVSVGSSTSSRRDLRS